MISIVLISAAVKKLLDVLGTVFFLKIKKANRDTRQLLQDYLSIAGLVFVVVAVVVILFGTRRYMVYILTMLGAAWALLALVLHLRHSNNKKWANKKAIIGLIGSAAISAFGIAVFRIIPPGYLEYLEISRGFNGILIMLLSPKPWSLSYEYGFLFVPSTFHWIFMGWSLVGMWILASETNVGRWLVIYAVGVLIIFGMTPEVLGPRHRFQVEFVFVVAQFVVLMRAILSRQASLKRGAICSL